MHMYKKKKERERGNKDGLGYVELELLCGPLDCVMHMRRRDTVRDPSFLNECHDDTWISSASSFARMLSSRFLFYIKFAIDFK